MYVHVLNETLATHTCILYKMNVYMVMVTKWPLLSNTGSSATSGNSVYCKTGGNYYYIVHIHVYDT